MPGVGKSTLARRAFEIMHQRGMPVYQHKEPDGRGYIRKLYLLGSLTRFGLCNLRYSFLSAIAILASGQKSRDDLNLMIFTWFYVSSCIRKYRQTDGIYMMDHGIFQTLWSIGFRADKADLVGMVDSLQPLMPTSDLVVVADASLATVERRLHERPVHYSRLENSLSDDPRLLVRSVALLEEVTGIMMHISRRRKDMRVLRIDNDQDHTLETNADKIADAIQCAYFEVPNLVSSGLK